MPKKDTPKAEREGALQKMRELAERGAAAQAAVDDAIASATTENELGEEFAAQAAVDDAIAIDTALGEIGSLEVIVRALEPLSESARARVLLVVALRNAPNALTEAQMMNLLRLGKEPKL